MLCVDQGWRGGGGWDGVAGSGQGGGVGVELGWERDWGRRTCTKSII